jgi:hypothetical protein
VFTTELFTSSVASGALNQVTSLYSGVTPTLNKGFQVPSLNYLGAVYQVSLTGQRCQIQAPSLRTLPYPDFVPVNVGAGLFESPVRGADWMKNPVPLSYTEEIDAFAVVGTTHVVYTAINLCDGPAVAPPPGKMFTAHATSSTTLTAGAFTTVSMTFDQALPAGIYALIGARVYSATAVIFKMIPAMGPLWQPGGIGVQAYDGLTPDGQRYGGWGTWLTFQQNVPPAVNLFATAADTAQEAWYDLIKVG